MAEVDTRIVEGMFEHLRSFSPEYPIQKPNAVFDVPVDANKNRLPFLRFSFLPARTRGYSTLTSGSNIHSGILQVSVFWPRNVGLPVPLEVAGAVARHFKRNTKIWREGIKITITGAPSVNSPLDEPELLHIPVSIPYFVTTPNE